MVSTDFHWYAVKPLVILLSDLCKLHKDKNGLAQAGAKKETSCGQNASCK